MIKPILYPRNLFIVLWFLLMLLSCFYGTAQERVNFKRLSINDGLSQNTVFCVTQDRTGYIWIGTDDGLNKYDGYEFTTYKHENDNQLSLSHSQINAVFEDPKGNLWVGTADGLNLFDRKTETFTRISTISSSDRVIRDVVTSFLYDHSGNLWVGTEAGLRRYDYETKKIKKEIFLDIRGGELSIGRVQTLFEDSQNTLWVSTGKSVKRVNTVSRKEERLPAALDIHVGFKEGVVRSICQDKQGNYYFGTETSGLYQFNVANNSVKNYLHNPADKRSLPVDIIRSLFCYSDNEIWIGTRDGLSIFNITDKSFSNYRYSAIDSKSLSHNSIRDIMKDKAGNVWIGTYAGGVSIVHAGSANFAHLKEAINGKDGLSHRVVSAIINADDGGIWAGTEGGGLNYINKEKSLYKSYVINSKQQNIVKSLAKDSKGNLWIGTYDGLSYLDVKSGKVRDFSMGVSDLSKNKQIYALAADEEGVWMGTDGRGLKYLRSNGDIVSYNHNPARTNTISGNVVLSLIRDLNSDNLWVGTDRGLGYFDRKEKRFRNFYHNQNDPYSISDNTILSMFFDSKRRLWVGTQGGGLNLYDRASGRFYAITTEDGLANNVVHAIQEDKSGDLWVSTNKGLSNIIFRNFNLPINPAMFNIMNYTVADGLQSNQFTGAAAVKEDGELLFGGINGITIFNPAKIIKNKFKPNVVITDLFIKNDRVPVGVKNSPLQQTIDQTDAITLESDQAFLTFKFAALNYHNPDKNEYAYKLEGFYDDDWHYVGNQRTATYTNLNAGTYIFKVKAANNDGLWNDEITELTITVLPPWWKTWWAFMLYASFIGVLLYLFYYYSYKTAKLKNDLDLEYILREKDQELVQRKLSFFTNISHEIKTPLTLILAPIEKLLDINEGNNKMQNQLMLMQRNGERLLRLINQLLDFRRFESGHLQLQAAEGNIIRFLKEISMVFEPYALQRGIKLNFISQSKSIRLWFDRDKLEKVIYNLLSNALKFTHKGGEIILRVVVEDSGTQKRVLISVEDNGVGISLKSMDQLFEQFTCDNNKENNPEGTGIGLAFSKGLVELHHGEIAVESRKVSSEQEGFTRFDIRLPLGKEHLSPEEIIADYKDSENIGGYKESVASESSKLAVERKKQHVLDAAGKEELILLVIEDNSDVREFISSHFAGEFSVLAAENGVEGLEIAKKVVPDIIISDVMMPQMDGITLCGQLKTDELTSHIPVILLTARTPLVLKIEGLETGADDYMTKPFNLTVLEMRVWNLLESRQKLRERYRKEISLQPRNIAITSPDEKFLEKVMIFIEENISEPILSVEELAKEVGMSRVTLYRKVKALTNQTAVEFIRTVRLKRAAQLLEQRGLNVNEVAYMVGFMDIDYFRRCFKDQFGYTPREYANSTKV